MSPDVSSSRPAIMRSVVLLPQPEGPTSTTNSLSGMSRLMLRTASTLSKRLTTLRNKTSAMIANPWLPLRAARGQAGDVVVHQKSVDYERRRRRDERAGHQHSPFVNVAADQAGHGTYRKYLLVRRIKKRHRIDERRPRDREGEDHGGDDPRQCHWDENLGQHLHVTRAID